MCVIHFYSFIEGVKVSGVVTFAAGMTLHMLGDDA
jgi:hypothetical protein